MDLQTKTFSKHDVRVLILAGGHDFGRCPLATRLPTALWPIAGGTSIEHLLKNLAHQDIKDVVILPGQNKSRFTESLNIDSELEIEYLVESMPVGTAGSIREASKNKEKPLYVLLPSSMICPPDIEMLLNEHIENKADLTVVLEKVNSNNCESEEIASGIFICNSSVLEFVPGDGYSDIKEGLIPKMLQAGKNVHAVTLPHRTGSFRDCRDYLLAVSNNIENIAESNNLELYEKSDSGTTWIGKETKIDSQARIAGPVIFMDNVEISANAIIIGPAVIGNNVTVGKNSIIINSIVWDNTTISDNCNIEHSILDYNTNLSSNSKIIERCIACQTPKVVKATITNSLNKTKEKYKPLQEATIGIKNKYHEKIGTFELGNIKYLAFGFVIIAFFWSYWAGLKDLWEIWLRSDEYSSGLLVPFLGVYIIWIRREDILSAPIKPSILGVFIFILAQVMRIFGLFYLFSSAERLSIILSIVSIVVLLLGWKIFFKTSTVILFLFLMLPWPNRMHAAVSLPLQSLSTSSAVFCLEVIGYDILREGNVIHIGNSVVAVAEACNGLRMITAFFVISGLVVLLVNRTWWEKLIVLISSLPVAFLCNTLRLTITAIIFTKIEGAYWEKVFHDFGGYVMMPLALAFIVGELWLIDKLTLLPEENQEIIIERQRR